MRLGFKFFALACWIVCAAFFVSCHHTLVKPNSVAIYYSDSKSVSLLSTSAMVGSIDEAQHLIGSFGQSLASGASSADSAKEFSGDVWVRANDSILSITLFGGFGMTIAELTYANDSVSFASSVIDAEKMKPEYVLADFQACFYPFEALRENFEKSGFVFSEKRTEPAATEGIASVKPSPDFERVLTDDGKVILRIVRKANEIDLVNELRHYKYHITLGSDG